MLDSNHLVIVKYHDVKNVERHGQYDSLKLRLTFKKKKSQNPILGLRPRVSDPIPGHDPRVWGEATGLSQMA